jgi:hypothetical protein
MEKLQQKSIKSAENKLYQKKERKLTLKEIRKISSNIIILVLVVSKVNP